MEVEEEEEQNSFLDKYGLYIIIGLAAMAFILLCTVIYFIATRNHKHNARKRKMMKKLEKQPKQNQNEE